jgi:hypothetical protein
MTGCSLAVRSATLAIAACVVASAPAHGFDLTGSWSGRESCRTYDGILAKDSVEFGPSNPVKITQTGNSLAVLVGSATDGMAYHGEAIEHASAPRLGRVVMTECRSDTALNGYTEVVHLEGSASSDDARLRGESIVRTQFGEVAVCKWQLRRTSRDDPSVTDLCPCCP